MSGPPHPRRPEWVRRLRRTRRRRIFWSTVFLLLFAGATAGAFLWTRHESSQLERSRQLIVLGVVGAGLVVATIDLLHPIRPKGAWLGVGIVAIGMLLLIIPVAVLTHPDLAPFVQSLILAVVTSHAGAMALVLGIGLVRDVRDTSNVRG
jgi:hypothetical protein